MNLLPTRKDWESQIDKPGEFFIDQTFFVTGVGTVVSGIVTQGTISANDTLTLGPDGINKIYFQKEMDNGEKCK
jgi:selenocysteine-specific translation elongation factor